MPRGDPFIFIRETTQLLENCLVKSSSHDGLTHQLK